MKKTPLVKYILILKIIVAVGCLLLFNLSCGLETYEVIDSPVLTIHVPNYDSIDYSDRYFEFFTNESTSSYSEVTFLGTDVYYKIYNNASTMTSERSNLEAVANSDNTAGAADRLINSYTYKQLKASNYKGSVLIPAKGTNQRVYIRLSDYLDIEESSAKITVNGIGLDGITKSKPLRVFDENTFNFGRSDDSSKNALPKSEDIDVKYNSTATEEGKWYITLFAVAVARDTTYTNQYSNILYLGTVTIDVNNRDN